MIMKLFEIKLVEIFTKLYVWLLLILLWLVQSCAVMSGKIHLSEEQKASCMAQNERHRAGPGIAMARSTDVLLYRNWQYEGGWNNLDSWKLSQTLFGKICVDFWKIPAENMTLIEHDFGRSLQDYLENYEGRRLILYFVSHHKSSGEIVLHDGSTLSLREFAGWLNKIKVPVWLIFDTCYARLLQNYLNNPHVAVYYAAGNLEKSYEFRPRNQKPSLSEFCRETVFFIKGAWNIDVKGSSPFGFFLLKSILENSYENMKLGDLIASVIRSNQHMIDIRGLSYYPDLLWSDASSWGDILIK